MLSHYGLLLVAATCLCGSMVSSHRVYTQFESMDQWSYTSSSSLVLNETSNTTLTASSTCEYLMFGNGNREELTTTTWQILDITDLVNGGKDHVAISCAMAGFSNEAYAGVINVTAKLVSASSDGFPAPHTADCVNESSYACSSYQLDPTMQPVSAPCPYRSSIYGHINYTCETISLRVPAVHAAVPRYTLLLLVEVTQPGMAPCFQVSDDGLQSQTATCNVVLS